ncbi:MAG: hypothetical protein FWG24_04730 [Eggerthellaceae bacterium]|nr:hypothetical protein [Eggerthellaceae bacterium]
MKRQKRLTIILLSLALIITLACAATFAALGSTTDAQTNAFSPSENISARLSEPNWQAAEAIKLVPGKTVKKDPMITNTSETEEYVAIRITFLHENGSEMDTDTATKLLKWLKIDWSPVWGIADGAYSPEVNQPIIFYYKEVVPPGQTTLPLFNNVYIRDKYDTPALTEDDLDFLVALGQFKIKIEGAALQAQGFESAEAAANELVGLFPA